MNGRRWFLKRAAMAPAAMAAMPAAVVQASVSHNAFGSAIGMAVPTTNTPDPWEALGISKRVWKAMDRERDLWNWRASVYRTALMGAVDGDIAGLMSLSPAAKARMQRNRIMQHHAEDDQRRLRLWPARDDDE